MFGEKALDLIKEIHQTKNSAALLPPFNEDKSRQVLEEMRVLFEQNQRDVQSTVEGQAGMVCSLQLRHSCLERNRRCLLAYLHARIEKIKEMRWEFGSVLPQDFKANLHEQELAWFNQYSRTLANYMRAVGSRGGVDLTLQTTPPKSLYIHVRCLEDFGEFETEDGTLLVLKKNSQHYMQRRHCEHLLKQGILEHIKS